MDRSGEPPIWWPSLLRLPGIGRDKYLELDDGLLGCARGHCALAHGRRRMQEDLIQNVRVRACSAPHAGGPWPFLGPTTSCQARSPCPLMGPTTPCCGEVGAACFVFLAFWAMSGMVWVTVKFGNFGGVFNEEVFGQARGLTLPRSRSSLLWVFTFGRWERCPAGARQSGLYRRLHGLARRGVCHLQARRPRLERKTRFCVAVVRVRSLAALGFPTLAQDLNRRLLMYSSQGLHRGPTHGLAVVPTAERVPRRDRCGDVAGGIPAPERSVRDPNFFVRRGPPPPEGCVPLLGRGGWKVRRPDLLHEAAVKRRPSTAGRRAARRTFTGVCGGATASVVVPGQRPAPCHGGCFRISARSTSFVYRFCDRVFSC